MESLNGRSSFCDILSLAEALVKNLVICVRTAIPFLKLRLCSTLSVGLHSIQEFLDQLKPESPG